MPSVKIDQMSVPSLPPQDVGIQKARPLDLFFDLVFVFAVSQIAGLIAHPHGFSDYLQAFLTGWAIVGMYNAFVWLTSNLDFKEGSDWDGWLMLLAMGCFFVMALNVPTVHGAGGIPFGLAVFVANAIHFFMFSRVRNSSAQAIWDVAPFNLASTLMVLFAGFTSGPWHWVLWLASGAVYILAFSRRSPNRYQFSLSPLHFFERYGLLVIIALGETIMGMGIGARDLPFTLNLLGYAALGLMLASFLWWSYFGPDNARAEHRIVNAPPQERAFLASNMTLTHFVMLLGIIFVAASLEVGIHHPTHHAASATAWNLALGVAIYFLGDVLFRRTMGIGPGRLRSALALAVLLTVPIGLHFSAAWQLLACALLVGLVTYIEDYVLEPGREGKGH